MPGDEAQPEQGGTPQLRTGPRHAAPRKSLLTRVHVPAGKAIALAAMPTAVLMGMGFTPRLAQAAEAKNAFSGDHCVSASDSPSARSTPSASPSTTPSATAGSARPGTGPTATPSVPAHPGTQSAGPDRHAATQAADTDSDSGSGLLGGVLGGVLGGILGGGGSTPSPSATPGPSPSHTATPTPSTPSGTGGSGSGGSGDSGGSGSGGSGGGATGGAGGTDGGAKAGSTSGSEHNDSAKSLLPGLGGASPDATDTPSPSYSPGMPYPCPTYDAKALAAAGLEQTPELLPNLPWTLKASMLTLTGLHYDGIVKVETESGAVKDVMKFTVSGLDIKDLHQIVQGPDNTLQNVEAAPGSTSTFRNGTVTLYTEELKGNLLGLIPIDFTPKSPPPLTVPVLFFTDVTVVQAGQFGGDLHIPGMHAYATPG